MSVYNVDEKAIVQIFYKAENTTDTESRNP